MKFRLRQSEDCQPSQRSPPIGASLFLTRVVNFASVIVLPTQTDVGPVIGAGSGFTVIS